jgi:hypothetical protein|tara:strand:+ start:973 stop:1362 length:390 start_codon:yes stop_codon:yes gene_type:complete
MKQWAELDPGRDPLAVMQPIPYKATGSKYGADAVRITGSPEFVDAVLSNLKTIMDGENHVTRLSFSRAEVKPTEINGETKQFENASAGAQAVYIQLHMRGHEGVIASAVFDKDRDGATERFEQSNRYAR